MSSINVTPLSIEEIVKLKDNVYVINNIGADRSRARGVLHISISDANGEQVQINLPKTWLPQNIANYCDVASIIRSAKFREMVRLNHILVLPEEEALAIIASDRGQEESRKIEDNRIRLNQEINKLKEPVAKVVATNKASNGAAPSIGENKGNAFQPSTDVSSIINDFNAGDDDQAIVDRILSTIGDKDSWIWASMQIKDTASKTYEAIGDKIANFENGDGELEKPAQPQGTVLKKTGGQVRIDI